jgi:hypothetical protein
MRVIKLRAWFRNCARRVLFRWWDRRWIYKQFRTGLVNALYYRWQVPKSLPIFLVSQTGDAPVLGLIFLPIKVNRSPTLPWRKRLLDTATLEIIEIPLSTK